MLFRLICVADRSWSSVRSEDRPWYDRSLSDQVEGACLHDRPEIRRYVTIVQARVIINLFHKQIYLDSTPSKMYAYARKVRLVSL